MSDTTTAGPFDPGMWTPIIERAFFARLLEVLGDDAGTAWPRPADELVRHRLAEVEALIEPLVAAGRGGLQPILCRFDLNWADAIDPARHHLRFVRPVTFASGATCRMLFTREERPPGLIA
ncbi:hypothetical protein Aph02nite_84630 [Actinoplanes philippinensis]|uniref:Uncharacterized protein n=1 Tax=Actinoplanes philippinensis TaxID=35752 RepID=A0A1I2EPJ9_9ACTN|nr:hypothetical protein [Actinoplanes philippinensis]GIE82513.1 hypothetical protein Aph02nite_84630 [Actinoplanes philippinensis]SFE94759.1 hypothetical protein SAMN05421541_104631 [Actinoplanes philippinensis]